MEIIVGNPRVKDTPLSGDRFLWFSAAGVGSVRGADPWSWNADREGQRDGVCPELADAGYIVHRPRPQSAGLLVSPY